jgi:hypothetical protein
VAGAMHAHTHRRGGTEHSRKPPIIFSAGLPRFSLGRVNSALGYYQGLSRSTVSNLDRS